MEQPKARKNGRKEGRKEGKKEGYASGKQKNKLEVIGRMLKANLSIDLIKECTKATDKEIEEAKMAKN